MCVCVCVCGNMVVKIAGMDSQTTCCATLKLVMGLGLVTEPAVRYSGRYRCQNYLSCSGGGGGEGEEK